MQVDSHLRKQL